MENGFITFGYPKKPWRPPRSRLVQRFPQWPKSAAIPGVAATGPANPHFIRDIGCAYLVTALALLWFAAAPEQARPAVLFGGVFLLLYAFVHFWDTGAGRESPHRLMAEIPTVILLAFLVLWLGWPPRSASRKEL